MERLRRGTWLAHICEHVTIALQNEMGFDVADEAWEVAEELGLPVILKPEAGNQGKGVMVEHRRKAPESAGASVH